MMDQDSSRSALNKRKLSYFLFLRIGIRDLSYNFDFVGIILYLTLLTLSWDHISGTGQVLEDDTPLRS